MPDELGRRERGVDRAVFWLRQAQPPLPELVEGNMTRGQGLDPDQSGQAKLGQQKVP